MSSGGTSEAQAGSSGFTGKQAAPEAQIPALPSIRAAAQRHGLSGSGDYWSMKCELKAGE